MGMWEIEGDHYPECQKGMVSFDPALPIIKGNLRVQVMS